MRVRDAAPSDREALLRLDPRADGGALPSRVCVVAEAGERLLGFGVLEYTFFARGFISLVYVAEAERRRGAGAALVRALEERCATAQLFTSTNASNAPMRALLARLGFAESGIIHNLDPGDPELVYVKSR